MIITAHGGAMGTGRNSQKYFERTADYRADALEIDVRSRGDLLYISHLPALFPGKCIPLARAFDMVAESGLMVNCDIKERRLVKRVLDLAKSAGIADKVYFTGAVTLEDSDDIDAGAVWLNAFNFSEVGVTPASAARIKVMIGATGNPAYRGINIDKRRATDEFMRAAAAAGLGVSVYTVDDPAEQRRLAAFRPDNITTNRPLELRRFLEAEAEK